MNKKTEQQRARLEQMQEDHRGITRFVAKVRSRQRARGSHFATEQPWSASSQNLPEIKETVFDCNEGFLNMCMHNLRCPETGYLLKKDTWFAATSTSAMSNVCIECDGTHRHKVISGSVRVPGVAKRVPLSEYAGGYTREFAEALISGFERDLPEHCVGLSARMPSRRTCT